VFNLTRELALSNVAEEPDNIRMLFNLLLARPKGISHEFVPNYNEHTNFVVTHPYVAWYFVLADGVPVGSCYIKDDNSIGLNSEFENYEELSNVLQMLLKRHVPQPEIKSVRPAYFYINVSSNNARIQQQLAAIGLNPIQLSFRIPPQL
jgi:hypothetical protein